jgi:hypothetical protein
MTVFSLKVWGANNGGDNGCCPLDYFDFGQYERLDIREEFSTKNISKNDLVVIGGGGLLNYHADWNQRINSVVATGAKVVVWGAGENTHFDDLSQKPSLFLDGCLVGVRDFNHPLFDYLPCPSCMSSVFDEISNEGSGIGIILHSDTKLPEQLAGLPVIDNSKSMTEVVKFIKSKKVILTNTYHGAYWSRLCDRVVVVFGQFSTRFLGLNGVSHLATYVQDSKFINRIHGEIVQSTYLAECRRLNKEFNCKVKLLTT